VKLSDLGEGEVPKLLRTRGLGLSIGPFSVHLKSSIPFVGEMLSKLYADYEIIPGKDFFDFHIAIDSPLNPRQLLGRQAQFYFDGDDPFKPLPFNQAYPFFEWGLNWCVAQHSHQYLILHSAVVEKDGIAAILPGNPGAGKSTFCAALVARGWRLLSDEMALIPEGEASLVPMPRPVALKNDSIDIMKAFAPKEVFGESFHDTAKGTVAHMRAPFDSVSRAAETAIPRFLVFPSFDPDADVQLERITRAAGFRKTVEYAFNYEFLGLEGVRRLQGFIGSCDCFTFRYSSLDSALDGFERIWTRELEEKLADA